MINTERLRLRQWKDEDLAPFAALNSDPEVMKYFPRPLTHAESDGLAAGFRDGISARGWGFWAVELQGNGEFVGTVGLHPQPDRFDFSPCTEIGWRISKQYWHRGLAQEAASAVVDYAFAVLHLSEVVSFTSIYNTPSETLMQRLGMVKQEDFLHPALAPEHFLTKHVLYRLTVEPDAEHT